jgi:hypothetical protein
MRLSDLRPCDNCGGKIYPMFYVVRSSIVILNADQANKTLGLARFFGGGAPGLAMAEVMGPEADNVRIGGDVHKELWTEIYLCQDCHMSDVNLAIVEEKIAKRNEANEIPDDETRDDYHHSQHMEPDTP